MSKYTVEQKKTMVERYYAGETVEELVADNSVPRSTLYSWIQAEERSKTKDTAQRETMSYKAFTQRQEHIQRLEKIITILKTCGCAPHDPLEARLKTAEQLYHTESYSVRLICEALDIPRGTFYNHIFRNKRGESSYEKRRENLRVRIREIYEESNQIFGSPKIAAVLQSEGIKVTKEMVRQLMREMGLESIRKSSKKQYTDEARKVQNVIKREFDVDKPNQVWVSDITYFKLNNMKFYICVILDLFARKVVAYRVGKSNSTQLVKSTFALAYGTRQPGEGLIFHSDQGSNYRARAVSAYLQERRVTQSFSNAGVPYDNSVMEAFFSSMKREELYRYKYRSEKEFRARVDEYIQFYNCKRPHKTLHYKTPKQAEQKYIDAAKEGGDLELD